MGGGTRRRRWAAVAGLGVLASLSVTGVALDLRDRAVAEVATPGGPAGRDRAVQALLDRRAAAVLARDERAFLADVDSSDRAFLQRQRAIFRGLARVPFQTFGYRLLEGRTFNVAEVTDRWGASATVNAVVATHRLRGYDTGDVAEAMAVTVARRGGRWVLVGDDDVDRSLPPGGHASPWDVGEVAVAKGRRSLVIGDARDRDRLDGVARRVDDAVADVGKVWPTGGERWDGKVVVYTARDDDVMSTYLDVTADPDTRPAAIALPVLDSFTWFDGLTRAPQRVGSRVIVDGSADKAEDDELLRHEITHVATMAQEQDGTPSWMVEGIAEYTAYRPQDLVEVLDVVGVDDTTSQALDDGTYALRLPYSVQFYDDAGTVEGNYTSALLACAYVAQRWGEPTLLRLHAELARSVDPLEEPDVVRRAFKKVLGTTPEAFERDAGRAVQEAWTG